MSAGNDLPHFKKDLLKDSKIQKIVFRTKQNLNLFYSADSKIQPYTTSDSSKQSEIVNEMNKEWENDPDFGKSSNGQLSKAVDGSATTSAPNAT